MVHSRIITPIAPCLRASQASHMVNNQFNIDTFLSKIGNGATILPALKKQVIFTQGDASDEVFYIQEGKVKLTVISEYGKEAVIGILERGAFFGESCLA